MGSRFPCRAMRDGWAPADLRGERVSMRDLGSVVLIAKPNGVYRVLVRGRNVATGHLPNEPAAQEAAESAAVGFVAALSREVSGLAR